MTAHAMPNLTSSDGTTPQFEVGDEYVSGGNHYTYCKATAASIAIGAAISGANPGAVEAATTTTVTALGTGGGFAGVVPSNFSAAVGASEYFWALTGPFDYQMNGDPWKVLAENATAGALLNSTANAGSLDDATTKALNGLQLTATVTTQALTNCIAFKKLSWVI